MGNGSAPKKGLSLLIPPESGSRCGSLFLFPLKKNSNDFAHDSITIIFVAMEQPYEIRIGVHSSVFLRDPDTTDLGRTIVQKGIDLIDEIGFEAFTFKKLGALIGSPESSIYRYFENKHKFLLYLASWYWGWLDYRLMLATAMLSDNTEKLSAAIDLFTEQLEEDSDFSHINEIKLKRIVISESAKAYHHRKVDEQESEGCYESYTRLVNRAADLMVAVNTGYEFPHMLVSTLIESAHQQAYFSEHLPSLTDLKKDKSGMQEFFHHMIFATLGIK